MNRSRFVSNRFTLAPATWSDRFSAYADTFDESEVLEVHRSLPEYAPTVLHSLPALASSLGLKQVLVKDESTRFGLKAFKALGSTYACYRVLKRYLQANGTVCPPAARFYREPTGLGPGELTFCTATDGNHGRGVAWAARKLNQKAVIYMPKQSVPARVAAIESEGAKVIVIEGNYDRAVEICARAAATNGWLTISDTSWEGYDEIPRWIMSGYLTMFGEIDESMGESKRIDLVLLPGGVGALAATAAWYFRQPAPQANPRLVMVEPVEAACLLESIETVDGHPVVSIGRQDSIMAGLNCGSPSPIAWPLIQAGFDGFLAVDDDTCREAMRTYFRPESSDPQVTAGESGAATLAGLLALSRTPMMDPARKALGLDRDSTVLLLNTEGDTDPEQFERIVADGPTGQG